MVDEFIDFKKIDFMINPSYKCKNHPGVSELLIDDDQRGTANTICLGCLYEMLLIGKEELENA